MGFNKTAGAGTRRTVKASAEVQNQNSYIGVSRLDRLKGVADRKYSQSVDWSEINGEDILEVIKLVTDKDDAVTFGRTSDGGAFALVLYCNGERKRFYEHQAADMETQLQQIATVYRE